MTGRSLAAGTASQWKALTGSMPGLSATNPASPASSRLRTREPRPTFVWVRPPKQLQSGAAPARRVRAMASEKMISRAIAAKALSRALAAGSSATAIANSTIGSKSERAGERRGATPKSSSALLVPGRSAILAAPAIAKTTARASWDSETAKDTRFLSPAPRRRASRRALRLADATRRSAACRELSRLGEREAHPQLGPLGALVDVELGAHVGDDRQADPEPGPGGLPKAEPAI